MMDVAEITEEKELSAECHPTLITIRIRRIAC